MNKNLVFFILSGALLVLSVITACLAPIINKTYGNDNYFDKWNIINCQQLDDEYKNDKAHERFNLELKSEVVREKIVKRRITECQRHKVMYALEYVAFIADVALGFICFLLGLIHFIEPGNQFEKISGIIGLVSGIITAIITIVYIAFSTLILSNEVIKTKEILYPNRAFAHWNGNIYIHDYDEDKAKDEDSDLKYIKYKDLGKIQYNYDSEFYRMTIDTTNGNEYINCQVDVGTYDLSIQKSYDNDGTKNCEYIWQNSPITNDSTDNKFLYDRWMTTIIFGILITICGICLGIFGLLLFNSKGNSDSSPIEIPINTVQ